MAMSIKLELCLPRDTATVPLVRHVLKHTLIEFGVTRRCVSDVELAITEACANVVEHAHGDDEYELVVTVGADSCEMRVVDTGRGFDHEAMADTVPDPDGDRGRGIALIKALVDHVQFESIPERGTVVHLVKDLVFESTGPLFRSNGSSR
jgi:serine/threonine-protein kinase RsbW